MGRRKIDGKQMTQTIAEAIINRYIFSHSIVAHLKLLISQKVNNENIHLWFQRHFQSIFTRNDCEVIEWAWKKNEWTKSRIGQTAPGTRNDKKNDDENARKADFILSFSLLFLSGDKLLRLCRHIVDVFLFVWSESEDFIRPQFSFSRSVDGSV